MWYAFFPYLLDTHARCSLTTSIKMCVEMNSVKLKEFPEIVVNEVYEGLLSSYFELDACKKNMFNGHFDTSVRVREIDHIVPKIIYSIYRSIYRIFSTMLRLGRASGH